MPHAYTKEDVLALCEKEKVKFVDLQFTDLLGQLKAVTIPVQQLVNAIDSNVWFDGSSIEGFARIQESDMYLKLDLSTCAVLPWTRDTGNITVRFICDVYKPSGEPYESDPRYILKKEIAHAQQYGYTFNVGPEFEFFILRRKDGEIVPSPHDNVGYFDQATDEAVEVRKEMAAALQEFGIVVEAMHHEVANGQHEIDFRYGDPLSTADNALTLKMALRMIAAKHSMHVTFMPKPFFGISGSAMHVHQSLFKDGKNIFYDEQGNYHLSETAKQFIAGQLNHINAMNAILNPLVNSYKRLVAGYEAPVYISWGQTNRSALIRIPRINPERPSATRVELRCPDGASNPYLAFSVMLAAGLDGIENNMPAPAPVEENVYEFNTEEALNRGIENLPPDLYGSLRALTKDQVIKDVLGDVTCKKYYDIKMKEWDNFRMHVTDWERERYLGVY